MTEYRLALFSSGNGTNAEEIVQYFKDHPTIKVAGILSNNPLAHSLTRAQNHSLASLAFTREQFRETDKVLDWLREQRITHIVLAGFMWMIPHNLLKAFSNHIINIHPALLPRHGGKGMYGMKVHESVKSAGETETGITIHLVNEHYDEGRVLFQTSCTLLPHESIEEIAGKVHTLEYKHYPVVIEKWVTGSFS